MKNLSYNVYYLYRGTTLTVLFYPHIAMQDLPLLSIGIPALNEARNIGLLLSDICKQQRVKIHEVIVYSDGSTDGTVKKVQRYVRCLPLRIIESPVKNGIAYGQNLLMSQAKAPILVILQADVRLLDRNTLKDLTQPIAAGYADMTSLAIAEANPTANIVSRALSASMQMKRWIFGQINNGHNVYTCYGPARAYSQHVYEQLRFNVNAGDDAYSYFYVKQRRLRFWPVRSNYAWYAVPTTLQDHIRQSRRFTGSQMLLAREFPEIDVSSEYSIPTDLKLKGLLYGFSHTPFLLLVYLGISAICALCNRFKDFGDTPWQIATSTKIALK